ncbi:hypothetical protein BJ123_102176 [Rhodopseudomonas thermotolerans]|uniref:Uncharacterized protein n=2 Tax=Rhodopseudomonas TaxID=1073 RepID=A0A336JHW5_9BRAD|nr:hypothetical protein BJ125_102174 [Rhodopseudomonas pentothenatexigens]REG07466.1 hypothetical protein BJ123_102176 [Rhodopseudomonas thermotolerans]SSW89365.1 hypothetical protein SAMN05892882_102174 [Rhodopseudomonas pentothenatexigens]
MPKARFSLSAPAMIPNASSTLRNSVTIFPFAPFGRFSRISRPAL